MITKKVKYTSGYFRILMMFDRLHYTLKSVVQSSEGCRVTNVTTSILTLVTRNSLLKIIAIISSSWCSPRG